MSIKDKFGLTTNGGTTNIAVFVTAMTAITAMPEGTQKTILMAICMFGIVVSLWLTKGDKVEVNVDNSKSLDDVLSEGRDGGQ